MLKIAVAGYPIAHSRSPQIHGAVLESINIDYKYEKHEVTGGDLENFLKYARENLDGFNLTMPLKVDVIPYLDWISESANIFRSVNTVKVVNGKLHGYNTDADGYVQALTNMGCALENKRIVILGAGGVVRTLAKKLADCNAEKIVILNRTVDKAREITDFVGGDRAFCGGFDTENISKQCLYADILINATPLGMEGSLEDFEDTSFLAALPNTALVSDLIYAPSKTKLLKSAQKLGLKIMNGFDMLIFQAILADEIYLNKELDVTQIYKKIINKV